MLTFSRGQIVKKGMKKADGINEPFRLHNFIFKKILTRAIFVLAPAANMLGTSRFPVGRMIWQYAAILESIFEVISIIIFFPVERTGLLSLLFSFPFPWTNYPQSKLPFPLLLSWTNLFYVQTLLLPSLPTWTKYSKSNSTSLLASSDKIILCPNSLSSLLLQGKIFLSHFLSD